MHGAWSSCRPNPAATMVGRERRERGWRAGRRSPQICARSREKLAWKGGKAKRKGRRREGGTIRPPPWLRAWRARIRPPPELARLNLCLAGRACSPSCAGRAIRGGEEAAEAQGAPRFNHRRSLPPRSVPHRPRLLAGVRGAGAPASLGSEEAAEAQRAPGFDHRLSSPPRSVPRRPRLLAVVCGAGKPGW